MVKSLAPTHCVWCRTWVYDHRLTLPRAKTGDLIFCNYACQEEWREDCLLDTITED